MTMYPFGPPVKVSPLIKFSRYTALIAGIWYGVKNEKHFACRARKDRRLEAKIKIARDKELAIEREKYLAAERKYVADFESGKLF